MRNLGLSGMNSLKMRAEVRLGTEQSTTNSLQLWKSSGPRMALYSTVVSYRLSVTSCAHPMPLMSRSSKKSQNFGAMLARPPNTPFTVRDTTRTLRRPLRKMLAVSRPMSEELSSRSQRAVGSRKDTQRISTASLALAQPHTTSSSQRSCGNAVIHLFTFLGVWVVGLQVIPGEKQRPSCLHISGANVTRHLSWSDVSNMVTVGRVTIS
ncbi:hypothetical protein INR49_024902 [Caranx melampygus]|nr:hypothetical protein INR49_024902 [Caranx melampygus]